MVHKKAPSITKQFFTNYALLFFILLSLVGVTSIANYIYVESMYEEVDDDFVENIYVDMKTFGIEEAFSLSGLPSNAYIEYISPENKVLAQYNSDHPIGFAYDQKELLRESNHSNSINLYIPKNDENFLLLYFPEVNSTMTLDDVFIFTTVFFIASLIIVLMVYVKRTSIQIIQPIQKLLGGIRSISSGNYNTTIQFQANRELNELKEAINDMAQKIHKEIRLREKSESNRKQLILDISHDLKTPLTNIQGYADTLLQINDLNEEDRNKYLQIIVNNSKRANKLFQDLFELSHMDMQETVFSLDKCDLSEWLRLMLHTYVDEFEERNIDYEFDLPEQPLYVKVNREKLERAISNLLNNSMEYSEKSIRITLKEEQNSAILIMEDKGKGIPIELHESIFEPFVRIDSARNVKNGGTGLGLAITKKIIEKHQGTITLDPTYKAGCRFIIQLPLTQN
ncbi:HAMP domain-containing sensor histidine kinase [Bacillus sp. FJAT-47783]|uniref:sensor histidine kinase n=1 Tax=Bacillus sp. FJAT-47783 TaxID=2922712 RepID=UPI001FABBCD1|nr:HAMP domain-containing sensor histidine kinase [Bacillus sp. FJAT-47783]